MEMSFIDESQKSKRSVQKEDRGKSGMRNRPKIEAIISINMTILNKPYLPACFNPNIKALLIQMSLNIFSLKYK